MIQIFVLVQRNAEIISHSFSGDSDPGFCNHYSLLVIFSLTPEFINRILLFGNSVYESPEI